MTEQLIKINERAYNKQRNEIAKNQQQIEQYLLPYKAEMEDTLEFKSELLRKQKEDLEINEEERGQQKRNMKVEMDEVSAAIESIDEMVKIIEENMNAESFVEVRASLGRIHRKLEAVVEKHREGKGLPMNEMVGSVKSLLEKDFKERSALKEMKELLEKLRRMTMDYRLEIGEQDRKNEALYEERKKQVESDRENNRELYESKMEQLDQTQSWGA